ncbi:hypothetical protein [Salinisphaera aquimarina]|uniref:EF-hand domain-containing protein n=1 Tax=Salinisphaera aquimarina TaxID=2094031 RepID=A0ABV7ER98_9GAMM
MFKNSLTVLALALLAGSGFATQAAAADDASTDLAARFAQLDSNGDGLLSRTEAEADSTLSDMYDSLDTSPTIEDSATNAKPGGITLDQFESGMEAAQSGGTVGPAASGGETFKVYPDGTHERVEGTGINPHRPASGAGSH